VNEFVIVTHGSEVLILAQVTHKFNHHQEIQYKSLATATKPASMLLQYKSKLQRSKSSMQCTIQEKCLLTHRICIFLCIPVAQERFFSTDNVYST